MGNVALHLASRRESASDIADKASDSFITLRSLVACVGETASGCDHPHVIDALRGIEALCQGLETWFAEQANLHAEAGSADHG